MDNHPNAGNVFTCSCRFAYPQINVSLTINDLDCNQICSTCKCEVAHAMYVYVCLVN